MFIELVYEMHTGQKHVLLFIDCAILVEQNRYLETIVCTLRIAILTHAAREMEKKKEK